MDYTNSFPWANSLADFYTKTAIPNAPKHTGRLPLSDREARLTVPAAVLFAPEPSMASGCVKENIQFKHSNTSLNEQVFGPENIEVLQQQIRSAVASMINAQIDRLWKQSNGGFGAYLMLAHNWANFDATRKSYDLIARHVFPRWQGQGASTIAAADRARASRPALAEVHAKAVEVATQRFAEETAARAG
jgi:hypothetical protein